MAKTKSVDRHNYMTRVGMSLLDSKDHVYIIYFYQVDKWLQLLDDRLEIFTETIPLISHMHHNQAEWFLQ